MGTVWEWRAMGWLRGWRNECRWLWLTKLRIGRSVVCEVLRLCPVLLRAHLPFLRGFLGEFVVGALVDPPANI